MSIAKKHKRLLIIFGLCILFTVTLYSYGKSQTLSNMPQDGNIVLAVKLNNVELEYNNSVGNEWGFEASVNGRKVKKGESIDVTASKTGTISITARAEEYDSIPDVGNKSMNISVNNLDLTSKNNNPVEVTVRENRGRYSGDTAKWRFNFTIQRKINLSDIIASIF